MSITVHRAMLTAAGVAVLTSAPALAQVEPNVVPDVLIECSKIEDVMARVACYDNNIRSAREAAEAAVPRQGEIPQGDSAPVATGGAARVERENVRSPRPPAAPTGEPARSMPIVAAVAESRPGAYLVTLEGGAQWEFAEDMAPGYRPPRPGSTVEIERGSLGSHRMRFDRQQPVRVRRVR